MGPEIYAESKEAAATANYSHYFRPIVPRAVARCENIPSVKSFRMRREKLGSFLLRDHQTEKRDWPSTAQVLPARELLG